MSDSDSDTTDDSGIEDVEVTPLAAYDGALDIDACNTMETIGHFERGPKLPDQMTQFDPNLLIEALAHFQQHYGRTDVEIGLVEPSDDKPPALALWAADGVPDRCLVVTPRVRGETDFKRGPMMPDQMTQFDPNLLIEALAHFQQHYGDADVEVGLVELSDDGPPALALWAADGVPDRGLVVTPSRTRWSATIPAPRSSYV